METPDVMKAVLGFLLGAASTYLGMYWKIRKELEAQYDKELRTDRQKTYGALWKLLQPLAKYSRPGPVTAKSLKQLAVDLRSWYFEVGGLYMSTKTRDAYFSLQDEIAGKLVSYADRVDTEISTNDFDALRKRGSQLRTATTIDIGSRKQPLIDDEASG